MQIDNEIYNFFFHPLSDSHSTRVKCFASITLFALTIFSGLVFLIPFVYFNLKDRDIRLIPGSTKETEIKDLIFPKVEPNKPQTVVNKVKKKHSEQLKLFEEWAKAEQWGKIHAAHYDWWMFPIDNKDGGRRNEYTVSESDIEELKKDTKFMDNYRKGVELVVRAWGWELLGEKSAENKTSEQTWTKWDVRLGKMANSLRLFKQDEYLEKLRIFAKKAILGNNFNLESWVLDQLKPKV
ncbi:MAG TPA: hypothetical protein VIH61_05855 [Waddliaceae bacterium]